MHGLLDPLHPPHLYVLFHKYAYHAQQFEGTMFARGLKRKSAEDGEDVEGGLAGTQATPSYSLQRQSLLDMSLVKLQLCHMLVEPNLCRSVLIANTVRQIQEEMTQDGTWRVLAPQAAGRAPLDRLVSTEILCRSVREQEGERPAADVGDGRTPGLVPGLSAVPSAQALRSPQSSLWEVDSSRENRGGFQKSLDQIFETLESKTPGSVEELFSDVDSSYYDLDAVLTGMVGSTQSATAVGSRPSPLRPPRLPAPAAGRIWASWTTRWRSWWRPERAPVPRWDTSRMGS
uniref:SERTA domain-containing protein n=1 Tax=Canis lupus familiaris TaxID=9615 RepID=A0A8C0Q5R6_CANLF